MNDLNIEAQIDEALAGDHPVTALRQLVINLNNEGIAKDDLLAAFQNYDQILIDQGRGQAVDQLEDVMDMMTGWFVGQNLDLK